MLELGIKGHAEGIVNNDNTAEKMGSGNLPVFATPSMVALIEEAAWKSLNLEAGLSTVGTMMNVKHISATPVGMKVTAETELVEIDRKRLVFEVKAFDEAGLIGEGTHERFIVDSEKFLSKTDDKLQK